MSEKSLTTKKCVPCEGGLPPLPQSEVEYYLGKVQSWQASEDFKKISKDFKFKNFVEAVAFVNKVADIVEAEGHHPDITISYNKVHLDHTTHAIGGLSENDFILAAKIDAIQ